MKNDPVIVCNKNETINNLPKIITKTRFEFNESELALVKPNICGYYHPSLELLSSIIEFLTPKAQKIVIGETKSMLHNPDSQFKKLGINNLSKKFGKKLKISDLSEEPRTEVEVPNPHTLEKLELSESVLNCGTLINVPKVGAHSTTKLTNAQKNLFGLLPEKNKYGTYHPLGIDKVIADIAQVIKPDLTIAEAEESTIIGTDPLLVDIVSCEFLDLDSRDVKHLELISKDRGLEYEDLIKRVRGD